MTDIIKIIGDAGFQLPNDIIHAYVGGSGLHGAKAVGKDDLDIYGVFIEPSEMALGLSPMEHFVYSTASDDVRNGPEDVDITLYSLRKLAGLLCKGNPTALNFLFAVNAYIGVDSKRALEWGEICVELKKAAISKAAARQFIGFVDAQMGRLLGTRGRGKKGQRPELEQEFGYDVKAGMHAVRLMHECIELMFRHRLTFPRPERETLLEIRTGKWSLDRVSLEVNRLMVELKSARDNSSLPEEADRTAVSKIVSTAYLSHWKNRA